MARCCENCIHWKLCDTYGIDTQWYDKDNVEELCRSGFGWSYTKAESIEPIKTKRLGDGTVLQFTKKGGFVAEYSSAKEARRQTGINDTTIGLICKGKGKTAGGFVWKYKNDV